MKAKLLALVSNYEGKTPGSCFIGVAVFLERL